VAQLVEDNRHLQATIGKLRDTTSSQTARLEEELTSKTRSVEILQEKLAAQTDYDEIKRELRSVRCRSLLLLLCSVVYRTFRKGFTSVLFDHAYHWLLYGAPCRVV